MGGRRERRLGSTSYEIHSNEAETNLHSDSGFASLPAFLTLGMELVQVSGKRAKVSRLVYKLGPGWWPRGFRNSILPCKSAKSVQSTIFKSVTNVRRKKLNTGTGKRAGVGPRCPPREENDSLRAKTSDSEY